MRASTEKAQRHLHRLTRNATEVAAGIGNCSCSLSLAQLLRQLTQRGQSAPKPSWQSCQVPSVEVVVRVAMH